MISTIAAEDLYWASVSGRLRAATHEETEEGRAFRDEALGVFPRDADELFCVCAPLGPDAILVCGVPRERLEALRSQANPVEVHPAALPDLPAMSGLADSAKERVRQTLNLLVGTYEPVALIRERTRRTNVIAAALMLIGLMAVVGAMRTSDLSADRAAAARAAIHHSSGGKTPADLTAEIERLRQLERTQQSREVDAATTLETWLAAAQSRLAGFDASMISVTPTSIGVSWTAGIEDDRAVPVPEGWQQKETRMRRTPSGREMMTTLTHGGEP